MESLTSKVIDMGVVWAWSRLSTLGWSCICVKMFIIVKFGADEEELFNPDCAIRVLLEDIKKRCHCKDRDSITFLDDKGGLVLIPDDQSMDNAASYFTHRGLYILLAIDRIGGVTSYISLLDDPGKELLAKLESLTVGTKPTRNSLRRGSKTPQSLTKPLNSSGGKGKHK